VEKFLRIPNGLREKAPNFGPNRAWAGGPAYPEKKPYDRFYIELKS